MFIWLAPEHRQEAFRRQAYLLNALSTVRLANRKPYGSTIRRPYWPEWGSLHRRQGDRVLAPAVRGEQLLSANERQTVAVRRPRRRFSTEFSQQAAVISV